MTRNVKQFSTEGRWKDFKKPDEETLRERLTPLQYKVTQENGTEKTFPK